MPIRIDAGVSVIGDPMILAPQVWLRADRGITVATGVSSWADQSGNGNHFVQGTTVRQPSAVVTLTNGLPGIRWGEPSSTANTKRLTSSTSLAIGTDFEMFFVVYTTSAEYTAFLSRPASYEKSPVFMSSNVDGTSRYEWFPAYSKGDTRSIFIAGANPPGATTLMSGLMDRDRPVLIGARRTGSTLTCFRDSTSVSGSNGNTMTANPWVLGGAGVLGDGYSLAGSVMEALTFGRFLTTAERALAFRYLSSRYKQAWTP